MIVIRLVPTQLAGSRMVYEAFSSEADLQAAYPEERYDTLIELHTPSLGTIMLKTITGSTRTGGEQG